MSVFHTAIILAYFGYVVTLRDTPSPSTTHRLPLSKACKTGLITVNDCNKCICTSDHYFNCISISCNRTDQQHHKDKVSCKPDMLYIKNTTACLCKGDGSWPHEACNTVFDSFQVKSKDSCKPNTFVVDDCNVCKCGPDGILNQTRCTKNKCQYNSRRFVKQNQVYGSCEAQNWYSLAPCQFCFCISENKLVCNTGNTYSKKLQLGSYNLSICGKELIRDAINLIPDRDKALRYGINKTVNKPNVNGKRIKTEYYPYIELNRENNENMFHQQIEAHPMQQQETNPKDSVEYYTDSEETNTNQITIGREGSSTKLPYREDENNPSSESDNKDPVQQFAIDINPAKLTDVPAVDIKTPPQRSPNPPDVFPQHFEWTGPARDNRQSPGEAFNLGDVLKPYLPVVLDKVFQMALRKSMVSVDAHANCTPGATTVLKCNACFCMKNNKLLCTNNECK